MAAPAWVWIAQVEFDPEIASKVQTKHNISPDEVREAICFGKHRRAFWDEHPDYGRRLIVIGDNYMGESIAAYPKPINQADGTWDAEPRCHGKIEYGRSRRDRHDAGRPQGEVGSG